MLWWLLACGENDRPQDDSACPAEARDTGSQVGVIADVCRCEEPIAEIGTGIEVYEDIVDDTLVMVHGPQGGWHLPAALRVHNTRNVISIVARVTDVQTGIQVTEDLTYRVQVVQDDTCIGSYPNMFLYLWAEDLDPEATEAEAISCREVDIEMCVEDSGGRSFCETRRVFVEPDPVDVASAQAPECEGR